MDEILIGSSEKPRDCPLIEVTWVWIQGLWQIEGEI